MIYSKNGISQTSEDNPQIYDLGETLIKSPK
jgi:hypothetical protein